MNKTAISTALIFATLALPAMSQPTPSAVPSIGATPRPGCFSEMTAVGASPVIVHIALGEQRTIEIVATTKAQSLDIKVGTVQCASAAKAQVGDLAVSCVTTTGQATPQPQGITVSSNASNDIFVRVRCY